MRLHSYLNSARVIVEEYDGNIPFTAWLKNFFKQNKRYGSNDRKLIAGLCYCYFRLGKEFSEIDINEKFLIGQFLCSNTNNVFLNEFKACWNEKVSLPVDEKLSFFQKRSLKIFSFEDEMSKEIDAELFNASFLIQPDVFLRTRPGKKEIVIGKLQKANIAFEIKNDDCIAIANNNKIDEILAIDEDAVIQDYNSQRTLVILRSLFSNPHSEITAWDCCAGSGGKSILLKDFFPGAHLAVSDIRKSILINLQNRFKRAGINNYTSFVVDLSAPDFKIRNSKFQIVVCDAPCSGSGTWSRTPEQLIFFKKDKIDYYQNLQKKISANASKAVQGDGYFLYITCSVFIKENEDVVEYIEKNTTLKLISHQYFKGYDKKADTLFVALFQL